MANTTKVYFNDSDQTIKIPAIDVELEPQGHVSITSAYHPPVILENFPGLKEITDLPEDEQAQHNEDFLKNEAADNKKSAKEPTDEQG